MSLQDKLQHLAGQSSGYLESLSPKVKRRVVVLQELQSDHDELEAKFKEERAALEAKYQKLYEPLYSKVRTEDYCKASGKTGLC
jgi:nucleosome assembly protein 1-like 1